MKSLPTNAQEWLSQTNQHYKELDFDLLIRACQLSELYQANTTPDFASDVLSQGIAMANELLPLHVDSETLASAICYPAVYYAHIDRETIEKYLNEDCYKLLMNAQKIESIQPMLQNRDHKKLDNLRKMLLAIIDDIRIVLIKLSEYLVILKLLRKNDLPERIMIAQQVSDLYAPLSNRLGMGHLKWQLEDLSFRFLNKEKYLEIKNALSMRRADREHYITQMVEDLSGLFRKNGIKKFDISGRAKHIYSIYRKMQKKKLDFTQLYDTLAFRVLVPSIQDCYTILGIVHSSWTHIPSEFDDYIAKPKSNGYQSIHTAIVGPKNLNIEIQIRSYEMHESAELGVAAHWKYKEGGTQSTYEEKINRLREIMNWNTDSEQDPEARLYSKIFSDRVYVFTPTGDVYDLPSGATPLDFAYYIHTEVGHRCRGAKINDVLVPLSHSLKTGDRVEIITTKESKPSRDWMNPQSGYLTTNQAIQKVRHWFKKANYQDDLEAGIALWEKYYRREGLKKADIQRVYKHFKFKSPEDLLAALGRNDFGIGTVINYLRELDHPEAIEPIKPAIPIKKAAPQKPPSGFMIEGVGNLLTTIARCCKPIPGDKIMGYITKEKGVTIHHYLCRNIQQAMRHRSEKILEVDWGKQESERYPVTLIIFAQNRSGMLHDVTAVITHEKLSIIAIESYIDALQDQGSIELTIEVNSLDTLDKVMTQLRRIPSVISVTRR